MGERLDERMGPPTSSVHGVQPLQNRSSGKSPATSTSDESHNEAEDSRGRRQDRRSTTVGKTDGGSDGAENATGPETSLNGKPRKRKRSRKGLDKKFDCPFEGCGKSYSRAEHLYRHQLNRESDHCDRPPCLALHYIDSHEQTIRNRSTNATTTTASVLLSGRTCARATGRGTRIAARICNGITVIYTTLMLHHSAHLPPPQA